MAASPRHRTWGCRRIPRASDTAGGGGGGFVVSGHRRHVTEDVDGVGRAGGGHEMPAALTQALKPLRWSNIGCTCRRLYQRAADNRSGCAWPNVAVQLTQHIQHTQHTVYLIIRRVGLWHARRRS